MAGVNKVILIGNLGADPEIRTTQQGATVANMRLAVSESWKDANGQRQERTEWVNLVAWRQLADIAQRFLRKGSKIYAEGKLQTRSWDDTATGQKRYVTEVMVDTIQMLDGRPPNADGEAGAGEPATWQQNRGRGQQPAGGAPRGGARAGAAAAQQHAQVADDDLPF